MRRHLRRWESDEEVNWYSMIMCLGLCTCYFLWHPWHSQEGAVTASSYRRQSWQQSEATCPAATAMTTLELSVSRSGLLAPKSSCSHYSMQVTQEDANRRKASHMLGLFSLMRMPAKSCHDRLRHSGLTYFKEESPTPIHPRKLSFLRNPPHRFEMFSTTRPFNGESWKKSYSCCLSNSKITWSLGTKYVFPGVIDDILEHSSNTPLLLLVYKGTASTKKMFSIKTLSLF